MFSLVPSYLPTKYPEQWDTCLGTKELSAVLYDYSAPQVWSLSHLYSVDFLHSRICVKSAFLTKTQSKYASAILDGVLGPLHLPSEAHLSVSLFLCSSESNEASQEPLKGVMSALRAFQGSKRSCWEEQKILPDKGLLMRPLVR